MNPVFAQVSVDTATKLASGYHDNATGWMWAVSVLGLVSLFAFCAKQVQTWRAEVTALYEKRIADRDQFYGELKEQSQALIASVAKNTEGLHKAERLHEELKTALEEFRRRGRPPPGTRPEPPKVSP